MVMDVDSTLIQQEVIDLLAQEAGVQEQVEQITELAMAGQLDFEQSLKRRVSLLKGLPESALKDVANMIEVTPGVENLIETVHKMQGRVGVVSGGFGVILEPIATQLGLDYWLANELELESAVLTGNVLGKVVDANAKAEALESWAYDLGIERSRTVAIGDGANDIQMLQAAGLAIAFRPKEILRKYADLVIEENSLLGAIEPIRLRAG